MRVALLLTFTASKKEPLAALLERIHAAFLAAGPGEPRVQFSFADAPSPDFVSSVDRVLKRFPQVERFVASFSLLPSLPAVRQITNGPGSPAAGEALDFATLLAIAGGVPRSFPFHNISIHLTAPAFGEPLALGGPVGTMAPGVLVGDSWWISGRMRSLQAVTRVDADPASKKLPAPPETVASILAACGKAKKTVQVPFPGQATPAAPAAALSNPEAAQAVAAIVRNYREHLAEILDRAALPHDLPPALEAMQSGFGQKPGPKKPVLVRAFKPLGYDCRGDSGTFTLRRRTPGNLTVEISLDVGSWSNNLTAFYHVHGLGFRATLPLPASRRALGSMQYSIGGPERWQQLVDNMMALVRELDRGLVPEIEAAAGPSPEWYQPES